MAAVDVVMPAPPPAPPAPVVRISRLALVAGDTVVCLWFVSLWVMFASVAAALIRMLVCDWGCAGAAWTAVLVSMLFVAITSPCAKLELTNLEEKGAAALEQISDAVVSAHLIAFMAFVSLEVLGILLVLLATKDANIARIASVIMVLPPLAICVMCCLVSIPGLAVRVWWMRRHGRASVLPI